MVLHQFARGNVAKDGPKMRPICAVMVIAVTQVKRFTVALLLKHLLIATGLVQQPFVKVVVASLDMRLSWKIDVETVIAVILAAKFSAAEEDRNTVIEFKKSIVLFNTK